MQSRAAIVLFVLALLRPCSSLTVPSQHSLAATPVHQQQQQRHEPSHAAPASPASKWMTSLTVSAQHSLAETLAQQEQQQQRHERSHEAPTAPPADWMTQCCGDKHLRQMYLPGSHDTGTYMWTTPTHMPLVLDEILSILFNIVGDLSRTQHLDTYQQLQAGARVLDIRLAINPGIAVQARAQRTSPPAASADSRSGSDLAAAPSDSTPSHSRSLKAWLASCLHTAAAHAAQLLLKPLRQQQSHAPTQSTGSQQGPVFHLDPVLLEGRVDLASVGGPLTAEETRGCITTSHSLPGAPLATVLRDVRRFLSENPGELLVLLVKADTIDVNVAGSKRFTQQDWVAAAEVFERELAGVQLVDEQQVHMLTLGQLAAGSRGGGSVLLYSRELQQQGLVAVNSRQAHILESWGNGTNTEDLGDLKHRLLDWLMFWRTANWRQNRKPFLLLASAETTLEVRSILSMIKNRIWRWQQSTAQQLQGQAQAGSPQQQQQQQQQQQRWRLQRALAQWEQLQQQARGSASSHFTKQALQQQQSQSQQQHQTLRPANSALSSGLTTLYQLGVETNQLMMQDVLGNSEVPKEFNVWSIDALSPDISSYIIGLNTPQPQPTASQQRAPAPAAS